MPPSFVKHDAAPAAEPALTIATQKQAREFADHLVQIMTGLLRVIEAETTLVRGGRIRDALELAEQKQDLARRYIRAISSLKANQAYLKQSTPELVDALHRQHDAFRAMLDVNLTVLATAHAVTEGIVRGVNVEMQRRNAPQTYTAAGVRSTAGQRHATPFALSRTL